MAYKRLKTSCILCKDEIQNKHFENHVCSKNKICIFCLTDLSLLSTGKIGAHVKWCHLNPNRGKGTIGISKLYREETRKKVSKSLKLLHKSGNYDISNLRRKGLPGKRHSEETKNKLSQIALKNNYQRVCKNTHEYIDKRGRVFKFDSSWEDALANRLDELDLEWIRPEPILYNLGEKTRRYFGDFYLPEYNVYLDPKNPYVQRVQREKIEIISKIINLIILNSKEECLSFKPDMVGHPRIELGTGV